MGAASNYLEQKILNAYFGGVSFTPPATMYLALFTVAPTGAGGGTEVTGAGYARLALTSNQTNWPAATGGSPSTVANGVTFTMAQATGDWSSGSNVTSWGLLDASSGGNLLWYGSLSEAKPVLNGDTFYFPAGNLSVSLN